MIHRLHVIFANAMTFGMNRCNILWILLNFRYMRRKTTILYFAPERIDVPLCVGISKVEIEINQLLCFLKFVANELWQTLIGKVLHLLGILLVCVFVNYMFSILTGICFWSYIIRPWWSRVVSLQNTFNFCTKSSEMSSANCVDKLFVEFVTVTLLN